jgi:hypothetical protein
MPDVQPSAEASASPITIVYDEVAGEEGAKGIWGVSLRRVTAIGQLDTTQLGANLRAFCEQMGHIFAGVTTAIS